MGIKEIRIENWNDFEEQATKLISVVDEQRRTLTQRIRERTPGDTFANPDPPLFRGHSNSEWKLETTLERATGKARYSLYRYYRLLQRIKPALESFLGNKWELNEHFKFDEDVLYRLPSYEFLVYLRQYGFPSPLLDWSRSPYIAAYFAYVNCGNADVAIYVYSKHYRSSMRTYWSGDMDIFCVGHYVPGTRRHFLQQSDYTYFAEKRDDEWEFVNAEHGFSASTNSRNDLLVKYVLSNELKDEVIKRLDSMNINGYSLFGTTESLLTDLFNREKGLF